jgi:murein DD-endopeptidase MepM/ murein hydrolase activator NlpD
VWVLTLGFGGSKTKTQFRESLSQSTKPIMHKPILLLATSPLLVFALAPASAMNGTVARQELSIEQHPLVTEAVPESAPNELDNQHSEAIPEDNPVPEQTPSLSDREVPKPDIDIVPLAKEPDPLPPPPPIHANPLQLNKLPAPSLDLPTPPAPSLPTISRNHSPKLSPTKTSPIIPGPAAAAPVKKLPSLKTPEGYTRVVPMFKPSVAKRPEQPISGSLIPPLMQGLTQKAIYPLVNPVEITSAFGWRIHPITQQWRFHSGTDLGAPMGAPVLAAFSGQVISSDWKGGYGKAIILQHGVNLRSLYGHLSESFVIPGQLVSQGTVIGLSGSTGNSTGPHLHFEVQRLTGNEWIAVDSGPQLQAAAQQLSRILAQK